VASATKIKLRKRGFLIMMVAARASAMEAPG